jgi:Na+-driven multidrug efflux pump
VFLLAPRYLLAGFGMTDVLVIDIGETLLRYLSVSGFFITVALSYTGGLQGSGDTRSPLYISILSQVMIPIGICTVLVATTGLTAEWVWTAILIGHMTRCALSVARFRQQKWRGIEVDLEPSKVEEIQNAKFKMQN